MYYKKTLGSGNLLQGSWNGILETTLSMCLARANVVQNIKQNLKDLINFLT